MQGGDFYSVDEAARMASKGFRGLNLTLHQTIERSRSVEGHDLAQAPNRTSVNEDERHPLLAYGPIDPATSILFAAVS